MKLKLLSLFLFTATLYASNEITIDSLFQKQKGFRSITNIDFLSSQATRSFSLYPVIHSYDDGVAIQQTKTLSLTETFLYAYSAKIDLIGSVSLLHQNRDIFTEKIVSKSDSELSQVWLGLKYAFDTKIYDFKQSLTLQTSLFEKGHYQGASNTNNLKSFNLRYTTIAYLDPVVLTLSFESIQNLSKEIGKKTVDFPNIYSFGLDANIVLNPKLSLSINFLESYQSSMKEDGKKVNPSTILSQIGFGVSYNLNSHNALILSTSTGTSAVAPDSRLSVSLWHKF